MQSLTVFCFFATLICSQAINFQDPNDVARTADGFRDYLQNLRETFLKGLEMNATHAFDEAEDNINEWVRVAHEFVQEDVLSAQEAAEIILGDLEIVFPRVIAVEPTTQDFLQYVCYTREFPFPDSITSTYSDVVNEINNQLPTLCEHLQMTLT